ncbi:cytosine deaminase [Mangrovibrevibacter kandeliae]|uniref:cytosine deaminase n=1 Tax=Mangrovibrevibacter kandeliae TaxID=2968473 RepID=UPI0021192962|nr:cytosine deaminase [Aurantimonas sp. CSK15Z-1]MCQ8784017.1 cytosine deaminase [Aurantimonas sp. CSK15Z-1]
MRDRPPIDGSVLLRNASLPDAATGERSGAVSRVDITIRSGRIESVAPAGSGLGDDDLPLHDCDGGLVLPAFVDMHTHLDKGHVWPRQANPDGTWLGALLAVKADREANWSSVDAQRRMDFSLRCAFAHGTAAIRTHLDSAPPQHDISWPLFAAMRERWAGRIELQAVALVGPDHLLDPAVLDEVARMAAAHGGLLGGSVAVHDRAPEAVRAAVETAGRHGLDLDLHIDESGDPKARSLRALAEAVIETGYAGRVTAGHCCSLAIQDEGFVRDTIARVAEAGITIVSLPMCNMYLQDRAPADGPARTPRWRGVTLVNELQAAGVAVALASDNTRDPFYAYGDLDMLEVFRESARIAQFDHPVADAWDWLRAVTALPAATCGFDYQARITPGASADLVLFGARTWHELMARPQGERTVLRAGRAIDTTLPDYRELDDLMQDR